MYSLVINYASRGSAGLRTSAAHSVQNAVSESDLEEREKHREKLRRVYQSISDFRSGAASDNSNKKPTGGSAGLAKWISARIPFVDGGDTRKTSQSKKAPSQTSQRDPNDQLSFTTSSTPKPGTFTLEALYISLARKLYDEGF